MHSIQNYSDLEYVLLYKGNMQPNSAAEICNPTSQHGIMKSSGLPYFLWFLVLKSCLVWCAQLKSPVQTVLMLLRYQMNTLHPESKLSLINSCYIIWRMTYMCRQGEVVIQEKQDLTSILVPITQWQASQHLHLCVSFSHCQICQEGQFTTDWNWIH